MLSILKLFLFSILLTSSVSGAEKIFLQVEGLSGVLEKNVRARLSMIQNSEIIPNLHFRSRVENAIREALKALGYYEPKITFNLLHFPDQKRKVLISYVIPGKPILINRIKIILQGGAKKDEDYLKLLNNCPRIGSVLNHGDYENFKRALFEIALRKGYFHAHFNKNHLGIYLNRHQAYWDIDYDSGERYRFGIVTFEGSQIQNKYLQNIIPFKEGDYYQSTFLAEFNRRFLASGWFNSVIIDPEFDKAHSTNILPIRTILSPRKRNTIEIGVGYSTSTGFRIKGNLEKPWINSHGHSLVTSTNLSEIEKKIYFKYAIPLLRNPIEEYYLITGRVKKSDFNNTELKSTVFSFSRYWRSPSNWKRSINIKLSFNHFIQSNTINKTMLLYPGMVISRNFSCGNLISSWSGSQRYSIDYSNTFLGSDINFLAIQAQNAWVRTFFNRHRLIARTHFGEIQTKNFEKVPPDLRFFAGGDRSIRGHRYKTISPKDNDGKLIGSSKLAIGSLEYQYNVTGKWWGVVFLDGGESVRNIRHSDFKFGTGIGARWKSFVGPIKLDFAIPLNKKKIHGLQHKLQFYIGLGPEV